MKKLFDAIEKDIMSENFSKFEIVLMGIIAPALFIALLVLWSMIQAWATL